MYYRSGEKEGRGNKRSRRTRGGELYDAFAGGSDDDDEYDAYRDRSAEKLAGHTPDDDEDQFDIGEESGDEGTSKRSTSRR